MKTALLVLSVIAGLATNAFAQSPAAAPLRVTVLDPSNAIIVRATVPGDGRRSVNGRATGAVIRIDGFEGGALPAKAQNRSIRISRDRFAAEYHSAGGVSIEIITQPGIGPIRPSQASNASCPSTGAVRFP